MRKEMYDFNLLVSCSWGVYGKAKKEIIYILGMLGDESPLVKRTIAEGIIGVKTRLNSREVVCGLRKLFDEDPFIFQYTLKWVPVDLWTFSDMDSMKEGVRKLRNRIHVGERWRMTVEKRRYSLHHKSDVIRELADLIDEKVDLENPEKILRVDIIGRSAGMSVLTPQDVFSVAKPYSNTL
ncbi:MAG: THUMP domain-containing protein [Candidatus Bathyarchaeota archaeon]|nr:THUMP domain-containing protein [Candidatus Bathyarchaeota archaeon]MDH5636113.1 THUMP domain-containing protein [Candidatus Bathyarchaeota archaeon]